MSGERQRDSRANPAVGKTLDQWPTVQTQRSTAVPGRVKRQPEPWMKCVADVPLYGNQRILRARGLPGEEVLVGAVTASFAATISFGAERLMAIS